MKRINVACLTAALVSLGALAFPIACGGVHKNDFDQTYHWDKPVITYRYVPAGDAQSIDLLPIKAQAVDDTLKRKWEDAVKDWHDAGGPEFVQVQTGADVDVIAQDDSAFVTTSRAKPSGDYIVFDESEGGRAAGDVLAQTALYAQGSVIQRATVRFRTSLSGDRETQVADHEAGHANGLWHSKNVFDVMYPIAFGFVQKITGGLSVGDKRAIRAVYGSR